MGQVSGFAMAAAPYAMIAGGVMGIASGITGGIMQYNQDKSNAKAEAEMLDYNSRLAQREASDAEAEMREAVRRQHADARRFQGAQRALYGQTGVLMDAGSPLAVLGLSSERLEMDKIDTMRQGKANQQRFLNQSDAYRFQSKIAGRNYSGASILSGVGTALGSLGMVAGGVSALKSAPVGVGASKPALSYGIGPKPYGFGAF